jgi:phage tail protein X
MKAQGLVAVAAILAFAQVGCDREETISETGLPTVGTVTAVVASSFGLEDQGAGVDLPRGLQVTVADGAATPVADAVVRVWPGGRDPQPMAHEAGGLYRIDTLSGRLDTVEPDYFFEVVSEWIEPGTVVLRVPQTALLTRPVITVPEEGSEHPVNTDLTVSWEPVEGADCYDVLTREHELQHEWDVQVECVVETAYILRAETVQGFSFIRVRAHNELGDETFLSTAYYSTAEADAQVMVFLTE